MTSMPSTTLIAEDGVLSQAHEMTTWVPQDVNVALLRDTRPMDQEKISRRPSYPTKCLNFLNNVNPRVRAPKTIDSRCSPVRLHILVVGAGLGGLSTAIALARRGHAVEIFEQASKLGEVGAGIQVPSNSSRILLDWGLGSFFHGRAVEPEDILFRRWQDGSPIAHTKLVPHFRVKYKAPYYVIHRADFHDSLHKRALELGVRVHVNHKVVSYDEKAPSVSLHDGRTFTADLIVAADGVKSIARSFIPNTDNDDRSPLLTGFVAYRATVDVERMKSDPETSWLVSKPGLNIWIGHDRHVMTYTIASGKSFNMVLSHVDLSDPASWNRETALKDMRAHFSGWDPALCKVIDMIDHTLKWPLMSSPPQDSWISNSGKLLLLGDAVHAMVPYMSQGAAMAVEDAAALAEALSHVTEHDRIPEALKLFEKVRSLCSRQMQEASLVNGMLWHFPDGPEQEARDLAMRPEVLGEPFEESPNQWSDPVTQEWTYGYDAVEEIIKEFARCWDPSHVSRL